MVALTFQIFNTYKSIIHSVFTGERKSLPLKAISYYQLCTIVCYCIIETSRFYYILYVFKIKKVILKSYMYLFQKISHCYVNRREQKNRTRVHIHMYYIKWHGG